MGLWANLKRGWRLGIRSVRVVATEPELLAFPVMSTATLLVVGLVALLLTPAVAVVERLAAEGDVVAYALLAVGAFLAAFVTTTVSTFFSAGLVHCAAMVFRGEEPDVRDGLAAAWRARRKIVVWGLVAASVALVVRAVERQGQGGRIVAALFGVAWGLLTYFVVPVIVLEDVGVREMFRESADAFRETWGENVGASAGVGVVFFLAVLAALGVLVVGTVLLAPAPSLIAVLFVAFFLFVLLLLPAGQAITGVVKTALYVYARDGVLPAEFADVDVAGVFPQRSGGSGPGRI